MKLSQSAPINPFGVDHETLHEQGMKTLDLITKHFKELNTKPVKPAYRAGALARQFPQRPLCADQEWGGIRPEFRSGAC